MNIPTPTVQGTCNLIGHRSKVCRKLTRAVAELRERLQSRYEQAFPGAGETIRDAVAQAEKLAWETAFPHLFFPDFAEVRIAQQHVNH